ncbi:hypothetical protein LOK49_LG04G01384 [Camellia lanceoleosa]|uniref:Uncharacterized protein n=1 Tax=Camellia lanceoleosa TaxID=1840588 RepID=A0ACC0I070_9ERIC|nr:hypothetical protein LOK49_LG04G01384 [Camellia lanceoleosa]
MGLGKGESSDVGKPKSRKKKNDAVEETGCWVWLRFIGSCISSRSKVDSSISGISTHCELESISSTILVVQILLQVWWNLIDKNALKFKMKLLEHMDLMRRVYEGATATGKFAWTPGAAFEPVAMEDNPLLVDEEDCEDSSGLPLFQPSTQHEHTVHRSPAQEEDTRVAVHAASSAIHADDTPTSGGSKRKFNRTTHP